MISRTLCGLAALCCSASVMGANVANEPIHAISSVDAHKGIHLVARAPDPKYNCPDQKEIDLVLMSPPAIELAEGEPFRLEQLKILAQGKRGESVIPEPLTIAVDSPEQGLVAPRPGVGGIELLALRAGTARLRVRPACPGRDAEVVVRLTIKPVIGPYKAALVSVDGRSLTLITAKGEFQAPLTEEKQEGFGNARTSDDHSVVGWVAEISNCCTSYPLPLALVLFTDGKVIQRIPGEMSIWEWTFVRHGTAVAYRARLPHGNSTVSYRLHNVADGKVIGAFDCFSGDQPGIKPDAPVPDWVWPIAEECPERN